MSDRFTIVPDDKTVIVNGEARSPLDFTIDPTIHAVQGYGTFAVIEYREVVFKNQMLKPQNERTEDLAQFQPALDAWAAAAPSVVEPHQ